MSKAGVVSGIHPVNPLPVAHERAVGRDQSQSFLPGLNHQQPIERIAMDPGEILDSQHVLRRDRQLQEAFLLQATAQGVGIDLKIRTAQ